MSAACLAIREALFVRGEADEAIAVHLDACDECRAWADAFTGGVREADGDEAFTLDVLLHVALVPARRSLGEGGWDPASAGLIPDIDPGPAFTARVLAATSGARAPEPSPWRRRWDALVTRPRFAFEAAYVLTVLLVLLAGNPLAAIGQTAARAEPIVERLAPQAEAVGVRVEAVTAQLTGMTTAAARPIASRTSSAWLRGVERRAAARFAALLNRFGAAARSATVWIARHLGEPADGTPRSS